MKYSSSYRTETPRGTSLHISILGFQRQSSTSESNFPTRILKHNALVHLGTKTNIQGNLFFSQETRYEVREEQLFLIVLYSFFDPLESRVSAEQWDFRTLILPLCVPSCFPITRVDVDVCVCVCVEVDGSWSLPSLNTMAGQAIVLLKSVPKETETI